MRNSAVRHLKPGTGFKYNNNKHIIVALTVEKLSGCGVLSYKNRAGVLPHQGRIPALFLCLS